MREGSGAALLVASLCVLFYAVMQLAAHDYLASVLLIVVGLFILRAAVELLRPTVGE